MSFTDTDKYINGTVALCGYAINSTIEYCQNKGNFSITTDTTSLQMGGIVGLAQNSTVQYCANTGDMTSWTPHTGGIVGQLYQASKIINCYSTGKMVPLGNGTTDFGGIAGIVGAGTEIRHCYFAGEMDLSQYTATTPYKRLGGIAGGVSSDTPVFENNYFLETENVTACFKYQDAGTEKTLDFMKTEDFFNEITAAGGNYRFNSNGTPLLPAPKYAVSFVVTPAELANVVIKVNGQEVTNPVDLEAGTYTVEVSADNCEVFNLNITITADTATHTQTIAMTYLPADYTKVDAAIAKANALNKDNYKDFTAVEAAVNSVVRDKNITEQSEVDAMAKAIEDAIVALQYKDADYTKVDEAIAKANALKKDDYKDFSAVEAAVNAVVRDKNITEQSEVDAMAQAIEDAIAALEKKQASVETLKKINGKWYYIKDGKQDLTVTKLVKYGTKWYYVKNGVVDFTATTLVKQNTKWYYVKNGVIDFTFTGLTKYNNTWFYVYKGVVNFNSETLVKYNTRWYYVKNGRVDFKYTGNVTYKGSVYYVKNGVMQKKVS